MKWSVIFDNRRTLSNEPAVTKPRGITRGIESQLTFAFTSEWLRNWREIFKPVATYPERKKSRNYFRIDSNNILLTLLFRPHRPIHKMFFVPRF